MRKRRTDARGLRIYSEIRDSYGARVLVKESSRATGHYVWIFVSEGEISDNDGAAHLSRRQAKLVRDALNKWLTDTEAA